MKINVLTSVFCLLLFLDCSQNDDSRPPENSFENFEELGSTLSNTYITASFQSAIYLENKVLVATERGIKKFDLASKQWSNSGLDDFEVISIFQNPVGGRLFASIKTRSNTDQKSLFLSDDKGITWYNGDDLIYDSLDNKYEPYYCFAVHPNKPNTVYANLEGADMIAVSIDGGINWNRRNYATESNFGYESCIAFMQSNPNKIYQGSENPLDDAWLAHYTINPNDPVILEDFTKIVDRNEWGNRRPNEMKSYDFAPNVLYVGQEGALSKITQTEFEYIYVVGESEEGMDDPKIPYSYISAIWVNRTNTDHLLFGGYINSDAQPLSLYETFNEGEEIFRFETKLGLENPEVMEILDTGEQPIVVLSDRSERKIKLVKYLY